MGLKVSCDFNFRKNLWKYGKTAPEVMPELVKQAHVGIGPLESHLVAPDVVLDPQAAADDGQVLAVLAVQGLSQGVILKRELGGDHRLIFLIAG